MSYYMDERLRRNIDNTIIPALSKSKDEDYVIVIDGKERTGKSTFGFQISKYIDPSFNLNRVCFNPDEFRHAIINADSRQVVVYDEAYRGLGSTSALSEVNKILKGMMMEMGQKNLCVIVILPTFYLLEKYVALWRARCLIHLYRKKKAKGFWRLYNSRKKQELYLNPLGKRNYSYNHVKTNFRGKFTKYYTIDEQEYRLKKDKAFKEGYKRTKPENYMEQRNKIIYFLYKNHYKSLRTLSNELKLMGVQLNFKAIGDIIDKFEETSLKSV